MIRESITYSLGMPFVLDLWFPPCGLLVEAVIGIEAATGSCTTAGTLGPTMLDWRPRAELGGQGGFREAD